MTAPTAEAPEAGAPEEMTLDQLLEQLREVSDQHVEEGRKAVQGRAAELRDKHASGDGLSDAERKEAKALKDAFSRLDAEKTSRAEASAELESDLADIPGVEDPSSDPEQTGDGDEESGESGGETTEAPAEEPSQAKTDTKKKTDKKAPAAVEDTPRLKLGQGAGKRESAEVAPSRDEPRVAIVAAAGDRSFSRGQELTENELYTAIWERQRRINHDQGGSGDYITVASLEHPTRNDRHLSAQNENENTSKLDAVTRPTALTAAGVCAPYEIDYSMSAIGSVARPVKGAFPQYTADRGGVQFRRDVDSLGSGPISASGTWTLETDASPGTTKKPIWDVPCNDVLSAEVQAVTLGLRFSNITNRFDPQAVAANTQAASVAHARYAEMLLLNSMYSQVTATFKQDAVTGAGRDILTAFDRSQAYIRNNRRQGAEVTLRTFLPLWIKDLIRTDMTRAMHTANEDWLSLTDAAIEQWFTNRQINVTWMLDGRPGLGTATGTGTSEVPVYANQQYAPLTGTNALPAYPTTVEFPLFVEGTFVYLDGGSLDIGVVRDQALVQQNMYITFEETFEGLYRKGVEALRVVQGVTPNGGSSGTIDPTTLS